MNKKFSTRYYLNLVLIDEENRRYFKQQEITIYRIPEVSFGFAILWWMKLAIPSVEAASDIVANNFCGLARRLRERCSYSCCERYPSRTPLSIVHAILII